MEQVEAEGAPIQVQEPSQTAKINPDNLPTAIALARDDRKGREKPTFSREEGASPETRKLDP